MKVGGGVVDEELDALCEAVELLRRFGFASVIVHGGGPQLNRLLEAAGVVPEYREGMRVTDDATLEIAAKVFAQENDRLCAALRVRGIEPAPRIHNIVVARLLDFSKWKHVGQPVGANADAVWSAIDAGAVPVATSMAVSESDRGRLLNVNADTAACEVSRAIQPRATVFVNSSGGIVDERTGAVLDHIDLLNDYDALLAQPWVKYGTRLKLKEIHALLRQQAPGASVAIVSTPHVPAAVLFGSAPHGTVMRMGPAGARTASPVRHFATHAQRHAAFAASPVKKVGLIGARGYTGHELLKLLVPHPRMSIACVGSRATAGKRLRDAFADIDSDVVFSALPPEDVAKYADVDAWVLALPNDLSGPYVDAIERACPEAVIVDLSADHRFDGAWVYGLPERYRRELRRARRIANPGCYATGAQMSILPLVDHLKQPPVVFGVSGYSGAGTTPSPRNDVQYLADNLVAYSLTNHVHEREVERQLGHPVYFTPHVAPFFRGISLTTTMALAKVLCRHVGACACPAADAFAGTGRPVAAVAGPAAPQELSHAHIIDAYRAYYADERLVRVTDEVPVVKVGRSGRCAASVGRSLTCAARVGYHGQAPCYHRRLWRPRQSCDGRGDDR